MHRGVPRSTQEPKVKNNLRFIEKQSIDVSAEIQIPVTIRLKFASTLPANPQRTSNRKWCNIII